MATKWINVILWTLVSVNALTLVLGGLITWLGYAIPVRLNQFGLLPEIAIAGGFASLLVACLGICALNYSSHYALNVYGLSCTIFIILMLPGIIPDASVKTGHHLTPANHGSNNNNNASLPPRLARRPTGHSNNGHLLLDVMYFSLLFLLLVLLVFAFTMAHHLRRKERQARRMSRQLDSTGGRQLDSGGQTAAGHTDTVGLECIQTIPMMTSGKGLMYDTNGDYPTGCPVNWSANCDRNAQELSPISLDCTCTIDGHVPQIGEIRNSYLTAPSVGQDGSFADSQLDNCAYQCEANAIGTTMGGTSNETMRHAERFEDKLANELKQVGSIARCRPQAEMYNKGGQYMINLIKPDRLQGGDPIRREDAMPTDAHFDENGLLISKGVYSRIKPKEKRELIDTNDKNGKCKSLPRRSQTSSFSTLGHHDDKLAGIGLTSRRLASYEDLLLPPSVGSTYQYPDYYLDTERNTIETPHPEAVSARRRHDQLHSCGRYQSRGCRRNFGLPHCHQHDDNSSMPIYDQQYTLARPRRVRCHCPARHGTVDSRFIAQLSDGSSLTLTMLDQKNKLANLNYLNSHYTMPTTRLSTTYAIARGSPTPQVTNRSSKSTPSGSVMAMTAAAAFLSGAGADSGLSGPIAVEASENVGVGRPMNGLNQFMAKDHNCVQMGDDFGTLNAMGTDVVGGSGCGDTILNIDSIM